MRTDENYSSREAAIAAGEQRRQAREIELLRAANAGDATAKRTIEARELATNADSAVSKLRARATDGDAAAMSALRTIAAGKAPASTAASAASAVPSKPVIDQAVKAAVTREQQRWAKVLRSDAAKGREVACVGILTMAESYCADTIIAQLPKISPDAVVEAKHRRAELDRHGDMWDRARRSNAEGPGANRTPAKPSEAPSPVASDPWAKAYAQIDKDRRP